MSMIKKKHLYTNIFYKFEITFSRFRDQHFDFDFLIEKNKNKIMQHEKKRNNKQLQKLLPSNH